MDKFSLEIEVWGEWQQEKGFTNSVAAIRHGQENFEQNDWRVVDHISGDVIHYNNASLVIQDNARREMQGYQQTARWRDRFALREAQTRDHLSQLASQQRARQRDLTQERRDRLSGFSFVGRRPDILDMLLTDEEFRERPESEGNWLKEGF